MSCCSISMHSKWILISKSCGLTTHWGKFTLLYTACLYYSTIIIRVTSGKFTKWVTARAYRPWSLPILWTLDYWLLRLLSSQFQFKYFSKLVANKRSASSCLQLLQMCELTLVCIIIVLHWNHSYNSIIVPVKVCSTILEVILHIHILTLKEKGCADLLYYIWDPITS